MTKLPFMAKIIKIRKILNVYKITRTSISKFLVLTIAVWDCGNDKAPGPDGYNFRFLKKLWNIICEDIVAAVQFLWKFKTINPGSNTSFITLVPKNKDPQSLKEYRPINLIGCITKIVSKLLTSRLKPLLDKVICPNQTAFVGNRNIFEGPLILNEIISWSKRAKKRVMLFKADFDKAFDTINWGYLDRTMEQMGFGTTWRAWIMGIISTARVSEFRMERGIRQGDPLSPFLFIIAAEGLKVAMEEAQEKNLYSGLQLPNNGPNISLLQYADDTIFVGEWSSRNVRSLLNILTCFYVSSCLKVNLAKCNLMGIGVGAVEIAHCASGIKCGVSPFPFKFLGLPVGDSMNKVRNWEPVINKFHSKLSTWKARTLSIGGRLTLCKFVLGSLGSYFFSIYKVPVKVLNQLQSIRNIFFWASMHSVKRPITWVKWKQNRGGLGISSLKAQNLALLTKWRWRFLVDQQGCWKEVIKSIYGDHGGLNHHTLSYLKHSVWGKITRTKEDLYRFGLDLDNVLTEEPDAQQHQSRPWRWEMEVVQFSARSLRKEIDSITLISRTMPSWWTKLVPCKINVFIWRSCLARLPTRVNLLKRGIGISSSLCPLCNKKEETEDHIFFECSTAKELAAHLRDWWEMLRQLQQKAAKKEIARRAFLWSLWKYRNEAIFEGKSLNNNMLVLEVKKMSYSWFYNRGKVFGSCSWDNWLNSIL
ncbi:hypothetical protein LXL04_032441 [Taraxacum kok-saghyz]